MAKVLRAVDVTEETTVFDLIEDVDETGAAILLKRDGRVVAVLEPADESGPRFRDQKPTPKQLEGLRSAAGSIDDETYEYLKRVYEESRGHPFPTDDEIP